MEDKTQILNRIIELAEARNLEVEQLKGQPEGSPDKERKLLELNLWVFPQTLLSYIAAIMYMGKHNQVTEGMFEGFNDLLKVTPKQELVSMIMREKLLPIYLKAGMKVLEQKNSSTP